MVRILVCNTVLILIDPMVSLTCEDRCDSGCENDEFQGSIFLGLVGGRVFSFI